MFANRKKSLLIAVGALLASSTAVAVLTFQTDTAVHSAAAASGSAAHTLPEELAGNTEVTGHAEQTLALLQPIASEPGSYSDAFSPPATNDEAPAGAVVQADQPDASASALSNVTEPAHGAAAPSSLADGSSTAVPFSLGRQLLAFGGGGGGGGYSLPEPSQPDSSTPEDPLTDFDSLLPPDSSSQRPDPIFGNNPQDGACDVFTGCGSLDDPPGSTPGDDSPKGEPPAATPVPEPGTMGLLMFGLALAAGVRRRRHA